MVAAERAKSSEVPVEGPKNKFKKKINSVARFREQGAKKHGATQEPKEKCGATLHNVFNRYYITSFAQIYKLLHISVPFFLLIISFVQ